MKIVKTLFFSVCLPFLLFVITGCSPSQEKLDIFDDEERIAEDGDSYSYDSRLGGVESGSQMDVAYEGFTGCETIWNLETIKSVEVAFFLDSKVEKGDFKVVLISPEKEVDTIISGTRQEKLTIDFVEGRYLLKLVGRNATGQIRITIEPNQNVEVLQNADK